MNNTYYDKIEDYIENCPNKREINWFDLPETIYVLIELNKIISIKKLIVEYGKNEKFNKKIKGIRTFIRGKILELKFPINLNQIEYIKIYSLMISEGSYNTEFSLNVPEKEFHNIFKNSLKKIISQNILIRKDLNSDHERSRAPAIIRYLLPFPNHLSLILFKNKKFAKEYLRIAFEAEGSPIYNLKKSKKYIKLSRNNSVERYFKKHTLVEERKIFINEIKKEYPKQYKTITRNPDDLILGEHILLKYWFNIDSTLKLESIRLNKLGNRKGKISAKWVLYIYGGEDIKKFQNEIGFMSENKKKKCENMLKNIPSRKKQYTALGIMKEIQKNNLFLVKDFNNKMREMGYVSPQKFIWDYWKNKKIIKRIKRGKYKIISQTNSIS
ncbi:MAG: hypothetical protein IIA85_02560 [Nanoarchaeota archaeon]|nr:hypothetical protein [Nanoarchaeota archaeon]